jgi:hypothetical protein
LPMPQRKSAVSFPASVPPVKLKTPAGLRSRPAHFSCRLSANSPKTSPLPRQRARDGALSTKTASMKGGRVTPRKYERGSGDPRKYENRSGDRPLDENERMG